MKQNEMFEPIVRIKIQQIGRILIAAIPSNRTAFRYI